VTIDPVDSALPGGSPQPSILAGWTLQSLAPDEHSFRSIIEALPAAIYLTDAAGRITYFNEAAAELWGHRPQIGTSEWCGSWKLYWPDGTFLPHDQCPMAIALKEDRIVRGMEAIAERPDGTRVSFIPFPTPLHDSSGALVGAVNMLVDISDRKQEEEAAQRLAAIVESSTDAILSKDLNGIITSWNTAAERLFGYTATEAIGRPVLMLIPPERHDEEPEILSRVRRGERIEHYETVRRRKDGSEIHVSLSVSPIRNGKGAVVGASKIARDITERRRAEEQQHLLLREMNHRVKNLMMLASSIVTLSARSASTAGELATAVRDRLAALDRVQTLTLPARSSDGYSSEQSITLHTLAETVLAPYRNGQADHTFAISGGDVTLSGSMVTSFALLLHEFATNAAKYGALSVPGGRICIQCSQTDTQFIMVWREEGGPPIAGPSENEGFGSTLTQITLRALGGEVVREWKPEGLIIRLSAALERLSPVTAQ
jgi:PAS domain S-box-containing protein